MPNTPVLNVIIRSKEKVLYDDSAYAVTSINDKGTFDILPKHENFITLIKGSITIHVTPKEKIQFQIENGLARVIENKVDIYVNFRD